VDALRYKPHPSHFSVDDAMAWIERIKPRRAILTNMHADLDYAELKARLSRHVEPAFDGMSVTSTPLPDRPRRAAAGIPAMWRWTAVVGIFRNGQHNAPLCGFVPFRY